MKSTCVRMTAIVVLVLAVLFGTSAQAIPCRLPNDAASILNILFPLVDANGDGGLSLSELSVLYAGIPSQYYDLVDSNRDGKVTLAEITPFLSLLPSLLPNTDLLSYVDTNGNGIIEYAEVAQYVTPAQFALLDKDGNQVIDCSDLATVTPPAEGETPPPTPTPPCPLPTDIVPALANLLVPIVDTDKSGGLSLAEIQAIYPIPAEYASYFSIVDLNHNGQIEPVELATIASALNVDLLGLIDTNGDRIIQYSEVSQYVTSAQFALLDRNGNGVVDCGDIPSSRPPTEGEVTPPVLCPLPSDIVSVLAKMLVPLFDADQSGGLSLAEINAVYPIPAEYTSYFSIIDSNHNGQIEPEEIVSALSLLGVDPLGMIDSNGDRVIQYSEVSQYVTPAQFALLDRNGNGAFDCGDLTVVSPEGEGETTLPCAIPNVNSLVFDAFFALLDLNHDGGIAMDEITRFAPGVSTSQLLVAFSLLANGGDGLITRASLDLIPSLFPMVGINLPGGNILGLIDTNGDGLIQLSEVSPYISASVFALFDTNGNGVLDCEDLNALLNSNGTEGELTAEGEPVEGEPTAEGEPVTEGEPAVFCPLPADALFSVAIRLADLNGDGGVSLQELQAVVPQAPAAIFPLADTNNDGLIDEAELRAFIATPIIETLLPQPQPTVEDLLALVDTNHNGAIDYAEISSIFTQDRFALVDTNHNGVIDCEDLTVTQPSEGELGPPEGEGEPPAEGEIGGLDDLLQHLRGSGNLAGLLTDAFGLLDTNGDGALSYAELSARIKLPRAVFNAADTNGDGLVTLEEVSALAQQAGPQAGPVIDLVREVAGRFGNQFFAPGDVIRVTLRLVKHGDGVLSQLHLLEALPEGWIVRLVSGADGVSAKSLAGNALVLDWSNATAFPMQIVYEATAPANASGLVTVTGQADYETVAGGAESTGAVASVLAEALPEDQTHSADVNHDWHLSLSEVLRVVQLYNSGGYSAETGTEDGYAPGVGGKQAGSPHNADYNGDWSVDISELLRVVQLFNAPGGAYYRASGTEDGFVPGVF